MIWTFWVRPSASNASCVMSALQVFGAALHGLTTDALSTPGIVFQIGVVPCRIDLLTAIDGVSFDDAWRGRLEIPLEDLRVNIIGLADLIANKRATARPKDLTDVILLEEVSKV